MHTQYAIMGRGVVAPDIHAIKSASVVYCLFILAIKLMVPLMMANEPAICVERMATPFGTSTVATAASAQRAGRGKPLPKVRRAAEYSTRPPKCCV